MTYEKAIEWCAKSEVEVAFQDHVGCTSVKITSPYTRRWASHKTNVSPIIAFLEAVEAAKVMQEKTEKIIEKTERGYPHS